MIYSDVVMSLATLLFVQQFVQANNNKLFENLQYWSVDEDIRLLDSPQYESVNTYAPYVIIQSLLNHMAESSFIAMGVFF